ncbi:MAG: type II toxin-antitoxin system RelE/ParE family toxin [Spirochaetales bacterium]|nr:type II toxin-antitoxin system RelE/ParE family toxin [Spirochaetales bacterium]
MKREIEFYETISGSCPVSEFLETLDINVVQKISWTLKLIKETYIVPKTYFKKLENTDDIWEVRVKISSNIYRIFSFWDDNNLIILTHGIVKKTQKTPKKEIKLAESYKNDYFRRKKNGS